MHRLVIVALPLLLMISQGALAQSDSVSSRVIRGRIVDDSLGFALPFVHLWNESNRIGSISSESGEFSINVRNQDRISFSALGYSGYSFEVSDSTLAEGIVVRLQSKKYELAEVVVRRWSSYAAFKHDFLTLDLPETEIEPLKAQILVSATVAALEADYERAAKQKLEGGFGVTTSLGAGINRAKEGREKLRTLEKREKIIRQKFNRELVGEITALEGDELTKFIALCNFSEDYLYATDLYTIVEAISAKFNAYELLGDTITSKHD